MREIVTQAAFAVILLSLVAELTWLAMRRAWRFVWGWALRRRDQSGGAAQLIAESTP